MIFSRGSVPLKTAVIRMIRIVAKDKILPYRNGKGI